MIRLTVMLYVRHPLSLRLLIQRIADVAHRRDLETVHLEAIHRVLAWRVQWVVLDLHRLDGAHRDTICYHGTAGLDHRVERIQPYMAARNRIIPAMGFVVSGRRSDQVGGITDRWVARNFRRVGNRS